MYAGAFFLFYVLSRSMYMETNDPKETAEDTTLTEDWQDPDFGGYPIEDDDD